MYVRWTDIAQLDYKQPEMREGMKVNDVWIREAGIDGFDVMWPVRYH